MFFPKGHPQDTSVRECDGNEVSSHRGKTGATANQKHLDSQSKQWLLSWLVYMHPLAWILLEIATSTD